MLKLACDNPGCETELEWADAESIPFEWWLIEKRVDEKPESSPVQYVACAPACVAAIADTLLDEQPERGDDDAGV